MTNSVWNVYRFVDRPDLPKVSLPNGSCFMHVDKVLIGTANSLQEAQSKFQPPAGSGYLITES